MPTIPQRIASAFAVLCGRYGDVTGMARDREQSRQSLYREAEQVIDAVDGTAARARVAELEQQVARLRGQVHDLQQRLERAVEMTPEKQAELACVAQAEGVSLPVARRLLQVLLPPKAAERADAGARHRRGGTPRRPVAGGPRRGGSPPRRRKPPPMRFFRPQAGPDAGRARQPLLARGAPGRGPRRRHLGRRVGAVAGAEGRGPRRRHRA